MVNWTEIKTGVTVLETIMPMLEKVWTQIRPLIATEVKDGKAIVGAIEQAFADFKDGIGRIKAAQGAPK